MSLQSRIAFNYIVSTALLTGILCTVILIVFKLNINRYNDEIVKANTEFYTERLSLKEGKLVFTDQIAKDDLKTGKRDKRTTYVEIKDLSGRLVYKSRNLVGISLAQSKNTFEMHGEKVRMTRAPVLICNLNQGTVFIGITVGDAETLMKLLFLVCLVGYSFLLVLLFIIARIIAKNSIKPIREIISISNTITHTNLSTRIPLPNHKDELYELSFTINNLLDRIEDAIEREKSFTSYASHEFRTPLSVLKGTMEVLIRRPRSEDEYKKRIESCIVEVDKLNHMVEQLLLLTRYEEGKSALHYAYYPVEDFITSGICQASDTILHKKLEIKTTIRPDNITVYTDEYSLSTILNNLISNAVKYCNTGGRVEINTYQLDQKLILEIRNTGFGIKQEELDRIFEKFYRSYSSEFQKEKGFGLGLPIVKRFCSLLNIEIEITSEIKIETLVKLSIPLN